MDIICSVKATHWRYNAAGVIFRFKIYYFSCIEQILDLDKLI